jgi:hypothetical protein
LKSRSILLEEIQNIRIAGRRDAVTAATKGFGGQTYITVHCLDIPEIVGPLLYCSARMLAHPYQDRCDTIIPESQLPVLRWQIGQPVGSEPIGILTLAPSAKLTLRFPPQATQQCKKALEEAAETATKLSSNK